jgi:Tol biopolymer transport system component
VFVEPGYLIFRRESALVAQQLDVQRLELRGTPIVVAENVGFNPISFQGFFSAANAGVLAYLGPDSGGHLTWFDRLGRRLGTLLEAGHYNSLCITPDGKRILYDSADRATGDVDIWSVDLARGTQTRLTFDPWVDFYPVSAPSGTEVLFASTRTGRGVSLYREAISAPGSEKELPQPSGPKTPTDWSRDGRLFVYSAYDPKTSWDIWVMPLTGGPPFAFAATTAEERDGRLSPDGRWMAYTFQQGGAIDVYVQPFPATGGKWQVSHGGGRQPAWRADGQELFYMTLDSKLVAVEVGSTQSGFAVGPPRVVVETHVAGWERTNQGTPFAVTPDGQRFLINTASDTVRPVTLILNWTGMLKK